MAVDNELEYSISSKLKPQADAGTSRVTSRRAASGRGV